MNLYLIGHDYRYAAEQMLLTLFPDERPEYPDGRPTGDRAELRLMSGTKVTTVTCVLVYHGQTANGRTSVPNGELTDPAETARRLQGKPPVDFPQETAIGALGLYVSNESVTVFQPMNINFGIMPPLDHRVKGKRNKNAELSQRSLAIIDGLREEVLA